MKNREMMGRIGIVVMVVAAVLCGCGGESSGSDPSSPSIVTREPASDSTSVAPDAKIRITFDQAIEWQTIAGGASDLFYLELDGQPRYGSVSYDLSNFQLTLTMTSPLQSGQTYQAVLEAGIRGLTGLAMTQRVRWSFRVR